jgi:putative RecB family exonuclease
MPKPEEVSDMFQCFWERQLAEDDNIRFDKGMDAESCAKQGRDMVACAVNNINPEEQVVAVNEAFCVPLTDALDYSLEKPLIGEIDCVVSLNGHKMLVDWKTAGSRWPKTKAAKDWQPSAFLYGYSLTHGEIPEFRFDVVVKNKTPVFEQHFTQRGQDDFLRLVELAKLAESMIAAEHFAPSEQGFFCSGCPHQAACLNWHIERARVSVRLAA